ncbi:MGMT family protein [Fredinandcohnia humi]
MQTFTEKAVEIIKQIPAGKIMTYGQIARLAGSPRGARQVVRILHSMSKKHNLPWFRVVNSKGKIGIKDSEAQAAQVLFLEGEGVEVKYGKYISLEIYQYHPE